MSLIDLQEKELLQEWAKRAYSDAFRGQVLSEPDKGCESYWRPYPGDADITEYGFDDIASLRQELEAVLKDERYEGIHLNLAVGAFKMYRMNEAEDEGAERPAEESDFVIPDFVYNF